MNKIQIAKVATAAYLITAVASSFTHIMTLFVLLGAQRWESVIAALAIDTAAVIGKIATGSEFAAAARRAGRRSLYVAGAISLAANISVGVAAHRPGSAIFGLIIVGGALWSESMIHKLAPKARAAKTTAPVNKDGRTAEQIKRSAAARKAAATRKANATAK